MGCWGFDGKGAEEGMRLLHGLQVHCKAFVSAAAVVVAVSLCESLSSCVLFGVP
jgi:hypothetical protein